MMNYVVDIIICVFLIVGILTGIKRGLIKTLVGFIGVVAVVIISYALKTPIANFLIDKLPFINFGGSLKGLLSLSILFYNIIAFIVVFIILYCMLNAIMAITGFVDTLLKFTVIWIIPSKIGGAIVGLFETWIFLYLAVFVMAQFSLTNAWIKDSYMSKLILDHTPIVGTYLNGTKNAAIQIYNGIEEYRKDESKTVNDLNLYILQVEINYGLISKEKAALFIETGKLGLTDILFG